MAEPREWDLGPKMLNVGLAPLFPYPITPLHNTVTVQDAHPEKMVFVVNAVATDSP